MPMTPLSPERIVEIANRLCVHSGFGVNWVRFEDGEAQLGCRLGPP